MMLEDQQRILDFLAVKNKRHMEPVRPDSVYGQNHVRQLRVDHSDYVALLKKLRSLEGVKKVFVRSGIRYDYLMYDQDDTFFKELIQHHISGSIKGCS